MAAESGSEHPYCNHTRQFLYFHLCLNFDKCDERLCAEPISKIWQLPWVCQRKSWSKTSGGSFRTVPFPHEGRLGDDHQREPASGASQGAFLLSLPRKRVWWSLRARDIALRAMGGSLLCHQHRECWSRVSEVTTRNVVQVAAIRRSMQVHYLSSEVGNWRPTCQTHQSNWESERGAKSLQQCLKERTAVAAASVTAQPTPKWD